MRKGKSLVTIASVVCAAALSFQVALIAPKTVNLDIAESNTQTATVVKSVSAASNEVAENYVTPSNRQVTEFVEILPSAVPLEKNVSIKTTEPKITAQKKRAVVLKKNTAFLSEISTGIPVLDRSFVASYLVDDICIDLYLDDIGNGLKEILIEYDGLLGERKTVKTGLFYDDVNLILFGKNEKGMLGSGFDFDYGQRMFFYSEDVFQRDFGFCELYDIMSPLIFDDLVTTRIKFNYQGMDWMVQLWKGRYITTMGGEIGIYNKPESRNIEFYDCGRDQDKMPMSMTVLEGDEVLFTKKTETCWWQTGFVFREFCSPEALTLKGTIRFPAADMKNAFVAAADKMTAGKIAYTVDGNTVSFIW